MQSTLRTTQNSIRDVNKLLKLDPSNTELLSQKQMLLKDAIGATKDKLETLKTAQIQAKQQLENGTLGQDLEALRDKTREMGAKTKFSASEAAEVMNYMAMVVCKTEDMISGIDGIMNLAAAFGEDLATTSNIVTDALTAFGLTAKDSVHFTDILAAASSNANMNVGMIGEPFKYCATIAGALGFSA